MLVKELIEVLKDLPEEACVEVENVQAFVVKIDNVTYDEANKRIAARVSFKKNCLW